MPSIAPIPGLSARAGLTVDDLAKFMNSTITTINQRLHELARPTEGGGAPIDTPTFRAINGQLNDLPVGRGSFVEITLSGNLTLTGIAGGTDGRPLVLNVIGVGTLNIAHQSTSSTEGNRLWRKTGLTSVVPSGTGVFLLYTQRLQSWIIVASLV